MRDHGGNDQGGNDHGGNDHGGNLDWARARFGGAAAAWVDLSTGINRQPYSVPALPAAVWTDLPHRSAHQALLAAARAAYGVAPGAGADIVALAGAQAAIQMIPRLRAPGMARVLAPTYNEHAACLRAAGWQVEEVSDPAALAGADLAVLVNPNNPDGRVLSAEAVRALAGQVGRLVVDESFADARPDLSVAGDAGRDGLIVLRSFGKFYGLAGLRLGFALGQAPEIGALAAMAGPWPVSGAALELGRIALEDRAWQQATTTRLRAEVPRLDALAAAAGWQGAGGCELFRLYRVENARAAQEKLARGHVWSRIFPWSDGLIRLGLPGNPAEWAQLARALA